MSSSYEYDYRMDKGVMEKQLTESNWTEFYGTFADRVSGFNKDVGYLLHTKEIPKEIVTRPTYGMTIPLLNEVTGQIVRIPVDNVDGEPVVTIDDDGVERQAMREIPVRVYARDEEGKAQWQEDLKNWSYRKSHFEAGQTMMMGLLLKSVSESILASMKLDSMYVNYRLESNLLKIVELAHKASTGQGYNSIYLDITKLLDTKLKEDTHLAYVNYCTAFRNAEAKIRSADKTSDQILENLFTSFFYMGLKSSDILKRMLEDQMSQEEWTSAKKAMATFNTFMVTRKNMGIDRDKKEGQLLANETTVTMGELKKLLNDRDRGRGRMEAQNDDISAYTAYRASTDEQETPKRKVRCFNCGEENADHMWRNCPKERASCDICKKAHHKSVHQELVDKKLYRSKSKARTNNKNSSKTGSKLRQAYVSQVDANSLEGLQDQDYYKYMMFYEERDLIAYKTSTFKYEACSDESEPDGEGRVLGFHASIQKVHYEYESENEGRLLSQISDKVIDEESTIHMSKLSDQDIGCEDTKSAIGKALNTEDMCESPMTTFNNDNSLRTVDIICIDKAVSDNHINIHNISSSNNSSNNIEYRVKKVSDVANSYESKAFALMKLRHERMKKTAVTLVSRPEQRPSEDLIIAWAESNSNESLTSTSTRIVSTPNKISIPTTTSTTTSMSSSQMLVKKRAPPKIPHRKAPGIPVRPTVKLPEPPDSGTSNC